MSNSISLPFLIIATGTILFVYMSVVIMELRSAYEESFWKQALKMKFFKRIIGLLLFFTCMGSPAEAKVIAR